MSIYFKGTEVAPIYLDNVKFKQTVGRTIRTITAEDLSGITFIGDYAFLNCLNLISLEIPNSVTRIGGSSFQFCTGLPSLIIPDGVTEIGSKAFSNCIDMTYIIIGSGVSVMDTACISNNRSLKKIVLKPATPPTLVTAVQSINAGAVFYLPSNSISVYLGATNWSSTLVTYSYAPLVDTVADLSNIDTTVYTQACVVGNEEYIEYVYNNNEWTIKS